MSDEQRAPLGPPAEPEVPHHGPEPGSGDEPSGAVEDTTAYELAVEDGAALPPVPGQEVTDDGGPLFREPGA
jgi:hypothetical protein